VLRAASKLLLLFLQVRALERPLLQLLLLWLNPDVQLLPVLLCHEGLLCCLCGLLTAMACSRTSSSIQLGCDAGQTRSTLKQGVAGVRH
jgi:hypothetical protein